MLGHVRDLTKLLKCGEATAAAAHAEPRAVCMSLWSASDQDGGEHRRRGREREPDDAQGHHVQASLRGLGRLARSTALRGPQEQLATAAQGQREQRDPVGPDQAQGKGEQSEQESRHAKQEGSVHASRRIVFGAAAFAVRFPRRLRAWCVRSVTGSCTRCAPVGFELLGNPRAGRGGRASTATCWSQSPAFPCASTGRSRTCSCVARSRSRPASAGEPIGGDAGVSSCCRRGISCGPMRRSQATGSPQARSIAAASRSPSLPRDAATRNGTKHAAGVSTDTS